MATGSLQGGSAEPVAFAAGAWEQKRPKCSDSWWREWFCVCVCVCDTRRSEKAVMCVGACVSSQARKNNLGFSGHWCRFHQKLPLPLPLLPSYSCQWCNIDQFGFLQFINLLRIWLILFLNFLFPRKYDRPPVTQLLECHVESNFSCKKIK